jgi:hypothetical protein
VWRALEKKERSGREADTNILSCLVLSINLVHCGNEFRNSVPTNILSPLHAESTVAQPRSSVVVANRGKNKGFSFEKERVCAALFFLI